MPENLNQFFDTSTAGFALPATFKTSGGLTIRTANVIADLDTLGNVPVGDVDNEAALPFISCKQADLASVDHSCKVVINEVTYRIVKIAGDAGVAIVLLQP